MSSDMSVTVKEHFVCINLSSKFFLSDNTKITMY